MDRTQPNDDSLPVLETESLVDCGRPPVSHRFVYFVAIKVLAVIVAIPGLVFGGMLYQANSNQQLIPFWWEWLCVGFLSLAIASDVIGRIGCWSLAQRNAGQSSFGASVGCQILAFCICVFVFKIGWPFMSDKPGSLGSVVLSSAFLSFVVAQGFAAVLFVTGIQQFARESGWSALERQASQLQTTLIWLVGGLKLLWFVVGCTLFLYVIGIIIWVLIPIVKWLLVVCAVIGGLLAILAVEVELQYLFAMRQLISELRRSSNAVKNAN